MIHWLDDKKGVSSDKGFVFQRVHEYYYHYIEGDHKMKIMIEPLSGVDGDYVQIYLDSVEKWLEPHDKEVILPEKKTAIRGNIEKALEFMDTGYIWSG